MSSNPASTRSLLAPIILGLAVPLLSSTYVGCKKDKPPPPLPAAESNTAPAKTLELTPEDAGADAPADADADAKKKVTGVYHASSLANCCAALRQNAASAPNETVKTYMNQAAAICSAMAAQGKSKNAAIGVIQGALKGAGMPAACR